MNRKVYIKQNDRVLWRWLFIWACDTLSILKALHINVWEMAISHRNGWRWWANAKCACAWRQLGGKNTQVLFYWTLELIFKAKLKVKCRNQKIQNGHQAAILEVTSLKIYRLLTINMCMKFEIEIPKQIWLKLLKPCRQMNWWTDGLSESGITPSNFIGQGYN